MSSVGGNPACAGLLVLLLMSPSALAGPVENAAAAAAATVWLADPNTQNADGSWGDSEDIRSLYTAAAVETLRAYGQRNGAYFRGITWLENHAMLNVDYGARRISALAPHGDDVAGDVNFLAESFSEILDSAAGWGLSHAYAPSPRDSALALLGLDEIGRPVELGNEIPEALGFLKASQGGDGGWPLGDGTTSDPIVTSLVLRAFARYTDLDPTLVASGDQAKTFLENTVTSASPPLEQSHAVLALLKWTAGAADVTLLVDSLVNAQDPNGSWDSDVYLTATVLRALAARLGLDDGALQEVLPIGDLGLRSAINLGIGGNRGDALRRGDLQSLTSLDANGFGIADLSGLEEAVNLTFLDLRNNEISDLTPILGILGQAVVWLQNNPWAGQLCDVVDDGQIDSGDALRVSRIMLGDYVPSLLESTRSDVAPPGGPGDGVVNSGDVLLVLQEASGDSVPVCGN